MNKTMKCNYHLQAKAYTDLGSGFKGLLEDYPFIKKKPLFRNNHKQVPKPSSKLEY